MKYKVIYVQDVEITYEAIVEATSEQEARENVTYGDYISQVEIDYQGNRVEVKSVEKRDSL